jgi:hypothetical protein
VFLGRLKSGGFDKSGLSRGFDDGWPHDAKESPADPMIAGLDRRAHLATVTPGLAEGENPGSIFPNGRRSGPRIGFAVRGDGTAWDAKNLRIFLHPKIRIFGLGTAEKAEKRRRRSDNSAQNFRRRRQRQSR